MANTRSQVSQIYYTRMQALLNKINKDKQDQIDRDVAAAQKRDKTYGDISAGLTIANLTKDLYEWRQGQLLKVEYDKPKTMEFGEEKQLKYKFKEDRSFEDFREDPLGELGESIKRLTPKGGLEETPGYEQFKSLKESREQARDIEPVAEELAVDEPIAYERLAIEEDVYTPVLAPTDPLDYAKIQTAPDLAQEQQLQKLRDIQTTPGVTPEVSADPELEKALRGLEELDQPLPKAIESEGVPIDFASTEGFVKPDVEVPDAKPDGKYIGKTLSGLQTLKSMTDIGETLTDEEASGEDKAIAGTQGVKLLADLAAKKASQETVSQIGGKAATPFLKGKGLQEGVKLGGKQAVGAVAGGVIGGYTMVTEAKEAGEAWEEKDYDEAILHGIGAWGGSLQMGGAGMMATGIGAPLGAVLYGIGTAGSVISSAGLMLEGLFGGGDEPEPEKPKFNVSQYLDTIRQRRSYY